MKFYKIAGIMIILALTLSTTVMADDIQEPPTPEIEFDQTVNESESESEEEQSSEEESESGKGDESSEQDTSSGGSESEEDISSEESASDEETGQESAEDMGLLEAILLVLNELL